MSEETTATVSKETRDSRKKKTGEFFTPDDLINRLLDKAGEEAWTENKTFLDPTAGNGNIVLAILKRKIEVYHHRPLTALSTIFAVELMPDNVKEMKERVSKYMLPLLQFKCEIDILDLVLNYNFVCSDFFNWDFDKWQPKNLAK